MALLRSPLHALHERLQARFVEFAGFEMPLAYTSILEEHEAVRTRVGLFDVSHMSNLWVRGEGAEETLSFALVLDPRKIPVGGSKYSVALSEEGTIVDDLYVFRLPQGFHVVPNAGMGTKVASLLSSSGSAQVEDVSSTTSILALQGPRSEPVLSRVLGADLSSMKRFSCRALPEMGEGAFFSRTGYTGEDGFELFVPSSKGEELFERILEEGKSEGIRPAGLGARDTLRLEKGYCLAGHEFKGGRTPLEAGLSWLISWDHPFRGREALEKQRSKGEYDRLVGIRMKERSIPREGCRILHKGECVGEVTSGTMSPTLKTGIALGYVRPPLSSPSTPVEVEIRGEPRKGEVVKLPFV